MLIQSLSQKLSQKLLPKLILNQNILAIPTLALDNIIKKELEENPMLEEGSEAEDENTETQVQDENSLRESDAIADTASAENLSSNNETTESPEAKEDNEFDWDEYFETESDEQKPYEQGDREKFNSDFSADSSSSVKDSLMLQLHLSPLPEKLIIIGEEIIWSLNDDGLFCDEPDDILRDLESKKEDTRFSQEKFTLEEINETLEYIKNKFDPPGIAARNLAECLLIQVKRSSADSVLKELTCKVISNHLDDLKQRRYEKISEELGINLGKVKEIFELIQKLDPRPGANEASSNSYIFPDLVVKKTDDDRYEVYLNDKFIPALRINKSYRELYSNRKKSLDRETKDYILNNFNRAKWFIDAIYSRRDTLLKIMEAILKRQREYFDDNENGLRPMYEKEIAEDIKMDTSTVSRAVRGKYVQTDFGIFELRSFFTTSLATNDGRDVSNTEAKNKLKQIIDSENKSRPLTDDELAVKMNQIGFKIARRTVAKYRESINIPIAKLRRLITD